MEAHIKVLYYAFMIIPESLQPTSFASQLDDTPYALCQLFNLYVDFYNHVGSVPAAEHDSYVIKNICWDYYYLLEALHEKLNVEIDYEEPQPEQADAEFRRLMHATLEEVSNQAESILHEARAESRRAEMMQLVGPIGAVEFTEDEFTQLQEKLNELRNLIVDSQELDAGHKQRVLRKVEVLQRELHRKMSSVDQFMTLVTDAGVMLGKFGEDATPFANHVKDILRIAWGAEKRAHNLPDQLALPTLPETEDTQSIE